jgi:hypothetical protein
MTARNAPTIENAPGLTWKPRKRGRWEARWAARADLVRAGFRPKSIQLYMGDPPDEAACLRIAEKCRVLQDAMHQFAEAHQPKPAVFDESTLRSLIACYRTDTLSPFHGVRYSTHRAYQGLLNRLDRDRGETLLATIKFRTLKEWHKDWTADGKKVAMGHSMIGMLRTVVSFGTTILESNDCARIGLILHGMRFPQGGARKTWINAEQATLVRREARAQNRPSVALAQALQFECTLRQKDVIGERVPMSYPGVSDVIIGNMKWVRGARWDEIDQDLIFTHITSKKDKEIVVDLTLAPMVIEEFNLNYPGSVTEHVAMVENEETGELEPTTIWVPHRELLPASGPMIVSEVDGLPPTDHAFRRVWRGFARAVGIPDNVFNMDTRSGAITEATDSGVSLDDARHAAAHSTTQMTQRYSRNAQQKIAKSMKRRVKHRKAGTK